MQFIFDILNLTFPSGQAPKAYGWFHILFLVLTVAATATLCILWDKGIINNIRLVLLITSIVVLAFELYKQIVFNITCTDGVLKFDYQWYILPWQFCSTPMFIGFVAGLTKGKIHRYLCSYLATYALFAGIAVMLFPGEGVAGVLHPSIGISIQTMICHGSMIVIGFFLYYTEHVEPRRQTLFKALPVFIVVLSIAVSLNEILHLLGVDGFNGFFVNRHIDSTLPVYSLIHNALREKFYILPLILYAAGFFGLAAVVLLLAREIKVIVTADYNAEYAEIDARRKVRQAERNARLLELEKQRRIENEEEREARRAKKEEQKEYRDKQRKEKREEREERRDRKREEDQRERAREKEERKREKEERREEKRAEREERREEKKKEREERRKEKRREKAKEKRLKKRMDAIEKREKKEKKRAKKEKKRAKKLAKKQKKLEKKQRKQEKKAYKRWLKDQKKMGNSKPDKEEFYDWYYG